MTQKMTVREFEQKNVATPPVRGVVQTKEDKHMKTFYGPEAKEGDYVLVCNVYGTPTAFPARVHNGKAYTGQIIGSTGNKFLHRLEAIAVIPESYVPDSRKRCIERDINQYTKAERNR